MGNSNGREENGSDVAESVVHATQGRVDSSKLMVTSQTPLLFSSQAPAIPLLRNGSTNLRQNGSHGVVDQIQGQGIPIIITWVLGGNDVAVEGSWDSWASRKMLQRSGKDHSVLLVLPAGIYHYKFIVDGEVRYIPDLPSEADGMGRICNVLDVNDYVPENLDSVAEFEAPPSPDSSYSQSFLEEEDFAKDPMGVPPQLQSTIFDSENCKEIESVKPQHVVLNHLLIEKELLSQSVVAVGTTNRFKSKYVTVVLYKPLKRTTHPRSSVPTWFPCFSPLPPPSAFKEQ